MGGGSWRCDAFCNYSTSVGRTVSLDGMASCQNMFTQYDLNEELNPYKVIRECCDTEEHPNTIPVILALDVTGSMGSACKRVAQSLNVIMTNLFSKYQDIEFMIMAIGDLLYDDYPIQASQFESDIRIAEHMDKVYFEGGGGGNNYESYSAAWYFGLNNTDLHCIRRGKKGIIITLGDEPLNPYLREIYCTRLETSLYAFDIIDCPSYEACGEVPHAIRLVFCKDFKGRLGKCYKLPIFQYDIDYEQFINSYEKDGYHLVGKDYCSSYMDMHGKLICENDIIQGMCQGKLVQGTVKAYVKSSKLESKGSINFIVHLPDETVVDLYTFMNCHAMIGVIDSVHGQNK